MSVTRRRPRHDELVTVGVSPGRFTATREQKEHLEHVLFVGHGCDVVIHTEWTEDVDEPMHVTAYVPGAAKGTTNDVETSVAWRADKLQAVLRDTTPLTDYAVHTGRGGTKTGETCTWAHLHQTAGDYFIRCYGLHLYSHVQDRHGWRGGKTAKRVIGWMKGARHFRRLVLALDAQHDDVTVEVIAVIDGNVAVNQLWGAGVVHRFLTRGTRLRLVRATHGDIGGREVALLLTTMRPVTRNTTLPRVPGFDHRPSVCTLARR